MDTTRGRSYTTKNLRRAGVGASMPIIILIPFFLVIIALFRDSVQKAFLNIYLPVFMCFPIYYFWKADALPPLGFSEAALLPIGAAIVLKELPRWRFSIMDVLIGVFIFTTAYADSLHDEDTAAKFQLFGNIVLAAIPYAAGKLLMEQNGGRNKMLRRIVFCLFLASVISAYEYRMGQNPFTLIWARFFPGESFAWKTQYRWGFGRVSGPYGQSELAGMMLFFGLTLTLYLNYFNAWEAKFKRLEWLPGRKSMIIVWTISITLLMTQARGPWIGSIIAVPIALIGRSKRVLRASLILGTLCIVGGTTSYIGLKAYANAPVTSQEQENAQYRSHLMDNYVPIAIAGGAWGWGQDFPRVGGQGSIDNEYLLIALTQGWVGLGSFLILCVGTLATLVWAAINNPTKRDRYFAFSLLGIMIGLMVTIFTVFLGNQPYELFFLLCGWSQAVRVRKVKQVPLPVFEHAYS